MTSSDTKPLYPAVHALETEVVAAIEQFHVEHPDLSVENIGVLRANPGDAVRVHARIVVRHDALPDPADCAVS